MKKKPRKRPNRSLSETERLLGVVHDLRRLCPWDRKQTHRSLMPYLLEESYETIDAIESRKKDSLCEELGDLLLQITLHAEIASERGDFDFEAIARGIADKMIRRHPHVFGDGQFKDLKTHLRNWSRLKSKEKPKRSMLAGIPRAMPALQLAQRYGEIAGSVGFDWPSAEPVFEKVKEELAELELEARKQSARDEREMELGDLLFSLANLARHWKIDAEGALRKSSAKFASRFERMEKAEKKKGRALSDCSPEELERSWEAIKSLR